MTRLQQLADATGEYEQAVANLRVGQDVVAALEQAQSKLNDADIKQKQAQDALTEAARRSDEMLQNAASAIAANTKADAEKAKAEADKLHASLDQQLRDAQTREREARSRCCAAPASSVNSSGHWVGVRRKASPGCSPSRPSPCSPRLTTSIPSSACSCASSVIPA